MTKQKVDLIIKAGIIVTMDKRKRVIFDGSLAVNESYIIAIDKTDEIFSHYSSDQVIGASEMLVAPGMIDCHVHLSQALLRGTAEELAATQWLKDRIWPLQGNFTEEDGRISAALCVAEMIKSGTTCLLEALLHERYGFDGIASVIKDSGIRGILSKAIMDQQDFSGIASLHHGMLEDKEDCVRAAVSHIKKWHNTCGGRIKVWFGPRPVGNCTKETYHEIAELAKKYHTGITIHHSEVEEQVRYCLSKYGIRPTELMQDVGLVGSNVVYAHCIFLNQREIDIIAETSTNVCHVPSSDMKLGMGIAPISKMLKANVNICLGCNGGANNNTYDMFRETSRACLLHRVVEMNPHAVSNSQALEMATINGAKALALGGQVGSIECGKKADLIMINFKQPHLQPLIDPISILVHGVGGQDVDSVVVDGQLIMSGRKLLTMDEPRILTDAAKSAQKLIERTGICNLAHSWLPPED